MLNSKDISRATQSHTLIYAVFECNLGKPSNDGKLTINSSLQTLKELVKGTHEDAISYTMEAHIITTLLNKLLVFFNSTKSKTATLWMQYMKMIEICLIFLKAECYGDWHTCHTLQVQVFIITWSQFLCVFRQCIKFTWLILAYISTSSMGCMLYAKATVFGLAFLQISP